MFHSYFEGNFIAVVISVVVAIAFAILITDINAILQLVYCLIEVSLKFH